MSISLILKQDEVTPWTRRTREALQRPEVRMVAARGVRNALQSKFQDLQNTRPNKRGWKRQNFWGQVRRSVQVPTASGDVVLVSINHVGIAQRFFGGEIRPGNAQYLTIPAREEAYGKRAREFDLEFAMAPDPERGGVLRPALVSGGAPDGSKARMGAGVMFWLTRQVEQKADPSVLPTDRELATAAERPVLTYLDRQGAAQ